MPNGVGVSIAAICGWPDPVIHSGTCTSMAGPKVNRGVVSLQVHGIPPSGFFQDVTHPAPRDRRSNPTPGL